MKRYPATQQITIPADFKDKLDQIETQITANGEASKGGIDDLWEATNKILDTTTQGFYDHLRGLYSELEGRITASEERQLQAIKETIRQLNPTTTTIPPELTQALSRLESGQERALSSIELGLKGLRTDVQRDNIEAQAKLTTAWNEYNRQLTLSQQGRDQDVQRQLAEIRDLVGKVPVKTADTVTSEIRTRLGEMQSELPTRRQVDDGLSAVYKKVEEAIGSVHQSQSVQQQSLHELAQQVNGGLHQLGEAIKNDPDKRQLYETIVGIGDLSRQDTDQLGTAILTVKNQLQQVQNDHTLAVQRQMEQLFERLAEHQQAIEEAQMVGGKKGDYDGMEGQPYGGAFDAYNPHDLTMDELTDVHEYSDEVSALTNPTNVAY